MHRSVWKTGSLDTLDMGSVMFLSAPHLPCSCGLLLWLQGVVMGGLHRSPVEKAFVLSTVGPRLGVLWL